MRAGNSRAYASRAMPNDAPVVRRTGHAHTGTTLSLRLIRRTIAALQTVGNGQYHSIRVGLYYRALRLPVPEGVHWFWIGTHGEYDKLVG